MVHVVRVASQPHPGSGVDGELDGQATGVEGPGAQREEVDRSTCCVRLGAIQEQEKGPWEKRSGGLELLEEPREGAARHPAFGDAPLGHAVWWRGADPRWSSARRSPRPLASRGALLARGRTSPAQVEEGKGDDGEHGHFPSTGLCCSWPNRGVMEASPDLARRRVLLDGRSMRGREAQPVGTLWLGQFRLVRSRPRQETQGQNVLIRRGGHKEEEEAESRRE